MKAAISTHYGSPDVLKVMEVPKPVPKDNEVLIRIHASAVNSADVRMRKPDPAAVRLFFGLFSPRIKILGAAFSGEVKAVGKDVTHFKTGDPVFGHTNMTFGAHAEYISVKESSSLDHKPAQLTHAEAAAIPFGGVTALYYIRKTKMAAGQEVLVVGASGAVGTAAVQLARSYGARVTGVCSSANVDLVKSIGADEVIDYTQDDLSANDKTYDIIIDTVNALPISGAAQKLKPNGELVLIAAGIKEMLQGAWLSMTSKKKAIAGVSAHTAADIHYLKALVEKGAYQAVIDRTYPLEQIAEAHAYVETGRKKGNVVITF